VAERNGAGKRLAAVGRLTQGRKEMEQRWIQFLFVAVPVMSLIGSWLALRGTSMRAQTRAKRKITKKQDASDEIAPEQSESSDESLRGGQD